MCGVELSHSLPNTLKYLLSRVSHSLGDVQNKVMGDLGFPYEFELVAKPSSKEMKYEPV